MMRPAGSAHTRLQPVRHFRMGMVLLLGLLLSSVTWAQTDSALTNPQAQPRVQSAPVLVDGQRLFLLRGVTAYPAEQRAAAVRDKIIALAQDESFDPNTISVVEHDDHYAIMAGSEPRSIR